MGHEVESMAFVGSRGLPWHIGETRERSTEMQDLADVDELLFAAGLAAWNITKEPIMIASGAVVPNKYATVRHDGDPLPLGVVGERYNVIQNETLADFGEALCSDGRARGETAGSLRNGNTVFMSFELDGITVDVKDTADDVRLYLLITSTHDGTRPVEAMITPVRVVCMNTLNIARIHNHQSVIRIRHYEASMERRFNEARSVLGLAEQYRTAFQELATELTNIQVSDSKAAEIFQTLFPMPDTESEAILEKTAARLVEQVYYTKPDLQLSRGTGWGVVNAVADYLDWTKGANNTKITQAVEDRRFGRILYEEPLVKQQAVSLVKSLA